ncbi:quinon protein alcohol dehydrogenase-like superfamily [Hygrophoropsis aurantiaca]|uniref:Quinon protein alcohol dehydrogenase-like superfamily n=1 Tax=Hygrophoropsis aurantiaca TaxID=72124 RepID=A0ACB7ZT59_9AGAM|nr:quinon protein alcohol dehydrogenase-like superfamily [Hygrophoropsis aurantiaca]
MATSASSELESPAPRLPTKAFEGHAEEAEVWSVAYFHDGKRVISGSDDKTVRIWDVESQKQEGGSLIHNFHVRSMALSPDERRLVSGWHGLALWDLEGRAVMWEKAGSEVDGSRVAYSPDGRLIAASHNKAIVLLNAETGEQIRQQLQFGDIVWCLGFSPDGTQLAVGLDKGKVQVLDVATGKSVVGPFETHTGTVTSLVYTLDGQQFITASDDKSIRVWDSATGQEIGDPMLGHEELVWQIALSRGGQRLASSSNDSTVRVWDLKTRRQIGGSLQAQSYCVFFSVAWSPDDHSIVSGAGGGTIYLWDVPQFDDHIVIPQAPAPTTSIAPLPRTSSPRAHSTSPSILSLPVGPSPAPPQSPEVNIGPGQDSNLEYTTSESFDSVLDLPADGTQSAQRRKKRRRRGAAVASTLSPAATPDVLNTPAIAEPESHAPQSQTGPLSKTITADAPVDAQTSGSRFRPLARSWIRRLMTSISRRTRKSSFTNIDDPSQARDSRKTTRGARRSQGNSEENRPESREVNNSRPRQRPQRHGRRNEEIGMIAPAPMYDRYQVATEEYWYDPQNPPLIDRIFFCMICCGVPKDNASYKTNADADPEPNKPTPNAQAGPSHSGPSHPQNQLDPSAANTATSANANTSTPAPRLGGFRRLWKRISNIVRRRSRWPQHESHQLQTISHATPQPSCHATTPQSSAHATPTSSCYATPSSSLAGYVTPTSSGSVDQQCNQI